MQKDADLLAASRKGQALGHLVHLDAFGIVNVVQSVNWCLVIICFRCKFLALSTLCSRFRCGCTSSGYHDTRHQIPGGRDTTRNSKPQNQSTACARLPPECRSSCIRRNSKPHNQSTARVQVKLYLRFGTPRLVFDAPAADAASAKGGLAAAALHPGAPSKGLTKMRKYLNIKQGAIDGSEVVDAFALKNGHSLPALAGANKARVDSYLSRLAARKPPQLRDVFGVRPPPLALHPAGAQQAPAVLVRMLFCRCGSVVLSAPQAAVKPARPRVVTGH